MNNPWLIFDCNYLCHRARYTVGDLVSPDGRSSGIIFGFLDEVIRIQEKFNSNRPVFCWDVGRSIRMDSLPTYKANRHQPPKDATPEDIENQKQDYRNYRHQCRVLRTEILPRMGYQNIFGGQRLEADDWIATAIQAVPMCDESIIVSADQDLYQLLIGGQISMYIPQKKKLFTAHDFVEQYGIPPAHWARVKAIAGCSGDNIPGIKGVGEKTAIKHIRHELDISSAKYKAIQAGELCIRMNMDLVKLPHASAPEVSLVTDKPDRKAWNEICKEYGMDTLLNLGPYPPHSAKTRRRNK